MTPPTARTWSKRGRTTIFRVHGPSQRRISIAALACHKTGERSRLIYRPIVHPDHKPGGRRRVPAAAHPYLTGCRNTTSMHSSGEGRLCRRPRRLT
ncbi:hypothetical protein [Streptomyces sp. QH1-20]|uniref:hypothetical protein n=1 Tax=Streptomyces sp. QH1-20 TaxID=3240934 RepID=UPI003514CA9E